MKKVLISILALSLALGLLFLNFGVKETKASEQKSVPQIVYNYTLPYDTVFYTTGDNFQGIIPIGYLNAGLQVTISYFNPIQDSYYPVRVSHDVNGYISMSDIPATVTPTITNTPVPTITLTPSKTLTPSRTPTSSKTPTPSRTPTPITYTPTSSRTPTPSKTSTVTPTITNTPTPTTCFDC